MGKIKEEWKEIEKRSMHSRKKKMLKTIFEKEINEKTCFRHLFFGNACVPHVPCSERVPHVPNTNRVPSQLRRKTQKPFVPVCLRCECSFRNNSICLGFAVTQICYAGVFFNLFYLNFIFNNNAE